jgi:hypothetical protein
MQSGISNRQPPQEFNNVPMNPGAAIPGRPRQQLCVQPDVRARVSHSKVRIYYTIGVMGMVVSHWLAAAR